MPDSRKSKANPLAERVYGAIKQDIFDFRLMPGDRFTESEMAARCGVSRTPVRDALYRLEREGYLQVSFRGGWAVRPFDFAKFDELYDLRIVLELAALQRLCDLERRPDLSTLIDVWLCLPGQREQDGVKVAQLDEAFHLGLVGAAGNREMLRVHQELSERIRVVRRLDFTQRPRLEATYEEHAEILRLVLKRKAAQAAILLRSHIEASKAEVRKITLHMLHAARQQAGRMPAEDAAVAALNDR